MNKISQPLFAQSFDTVSRLIIGICGASGIQYGIRLLELLRPELIETHLIVSKSAWQVRHYEAKISKEALLNLADKHYSVDDITCPLSSGSFITAGMIVAPCSMHTLARIANGFSDNALTRAADVVLKERRRLVLLPRETPLNQAHLENMLKVTQMGGIIAPPVPAFYPLPETIDDIINHTLGRVLDLFGLDIGVTKRWKDNENY